MKSLKVPGHTAGSMAYLVDGEYLFTGDAVKIKENKMELHPYSMDQERAKESIKKLSDWKEKCKWILTAHYGCFEI